MTDDISYTVNKKRDTLYRHPTDKGTHVEIVGDFDKEGHLIGEINFHPVFKLQVYAFHVKSSDDYGRFKIRKLQRNKRRGWYTDGEVILNYFQMAHIKELISIISSLDLSNSTKAKIALSDANLEAVGAILSSDQGANLIKEISENPALSTDIFAVSQKRSVLNEFEAMLNEQHSEKDWQNFFERNPWIFGHGLNYVFTEKVSEKLEAATTGATFDRGGKRVDALMRTRAEISQYVLVEIKKPDSKLLKDTQYRKGCWQTSDELSGAISQIQKTVFEFTRSRFKDQLKDADGNDLKQAVYAIEPKSYLIIGSLKQLATNDDKFSCFELLRRNTHSPDIITFDELFERARCIVENLSHY